MPELKYAEAVRAALRAELEADDRVFVMGEEVAALGGVFTTTQGLVDQFGAHRVVDTPIAESAIVGWAVGAATEGLRPVVEIMFMDFIGCAMDQVVNSAAKLRYMSGGQYRVPLVIRMPADAGTHHGPQHSQHVETWFAHVPGLVVAMPSNARDAYEMLRAEIQSDDPTIFVESKYLYFRDRGEVDEGRVSLDQCRRARLVRRGSDLTVVSAGRMVNLTLEACARLADDGIECDVVDLRYLHPLDLDPVVDSITRTNRLAVVHEAVTFCGWGAEVVAAICDNESSMFHLEAPIRRIGTARSPIPFSPVLEEAVVPTVDRIEAELRSLAAFE